MLLQQKKRFDIMLGKHWKLHWSWLKLAMSKLWFKYKKNLSSSCLSCNQGFFLCHHNSLSIWGQHLLFQPHNSTFHLECRARLSELVKVTMPFSLHRQHMFSCKQTKSYQPVCECTCITKLINTVFQAILLIYHC